MKHRVLAALLIGSLTASLHAQAALQHTFALKDGVFQMDGKPFQVLSGEMHYPRIPRAQWRYAMRMAKAMGLNTVTTYVFWNAHQAVPGHYDFSGQLDLAAFLKTAQEEGLFVVLRPGPYACAEWEFGGYPAWLLKDRTTVVRSLDPKYMEPAKRWFMKLGEVVKPMLLANGGPIIAVQVENEYGSFGADHDYMRAVKQSVMDSGMGGTPEHPTLLYTADGGVQQPKGSLPGVTAAVNFGPGDAKRETARLRAFRPDGPKWVTEYWAGWFDHWGVTHKPTNTQKQVDEYESLIRDGYSVNLYMLWGGTSFGWMNGANIDHKQYEPDITSYDYDAPINERGEPQEKYMKLREAIHRAMGSPLVDVPKLAPAATYAMDDAKESASLWENLPKPVVSDTLKTMEELGQNYGWVLYTTRAAKAGKLTIEGLHDYAAVFIDRKYVGSIDRRKSESAIDLPSAGEVEILVENTGRVNYSISLREESKGILGRVLLDDAALSGWKIYSLSMDGKIRFKKRACNGPCFFRTTMDGGAADTYIDTSAVSKGFVWLNGAPLGRAWSVGPQGALFVPGSWLKAKNSVVVFDIGAQRAPVLKTVEHAVWVKGDLK